jgi:hypothetical protein
MSEQKPTSEFLDASKLPTKPIQLRTLSYLHLYLQVRAICSTNRPLAVFGVG